MEQYVSFFTHHWALTSLLVIVVLAIILYEMRTMAVGPGRLSAQAVIQLMNHDNAAVIDIRDRAAFKLGHVVGSVNIITSEIENDIHKLDRYKSRPIVLVCVVGVTALRLASTLNKNEFGNVNVLSGGIKAWQDAGLPLEK